MAKPPAPARGKSQFACLDCGAVLNKWAGQCPECGAWNRIEEVRSAGRGHYAGAMAAAPRALGEVSAALPARQGSGLSELDRALGGGLVAGSVNLLGGDPGIGKSTLLLQSLAHLAEVAALPVLYVSGEESLAQLALRAERLDLPRTRLVALAETRLEAILAVLEQQAPRVVVIDSIQTLHSEGMGSAPGSVAQVRDCAAALTRWAKSSGAALWLIGHVTKEGAIAGPRVLEHMVDAVLYFEGDSGSRFRMVRAVKNRFGAAQELGVFAMTETGLKPVANPSALFLARPERPIPGSVVFPAWEGSRALLVEVQALVTRGGGSARRLAVGLDSNRLALILAVLQRHAGVELWDQDVFVSVVGGVRVTEAAADLAVALAVLSSLYNRPVPQDWLAFGELGLAGEVRPAPFGPERLKEAMKQGLKLALLPASNQWPAVALPQRPCAHLDALVAALRD